MFFHRPRFLSNALKLRIEGKETIPLFGIGKLKIGEKLERNCDISKKIPLFGSRRLKIGEKLERNCEIAKKIPLFGIGRLKIGKKLERNCEIAKKVPFQRIKNRISRNCYFRTNCHFLKKGKLKIL